MSWISLFQVALFIRGMLEVMGCLSHKPLRSKVKDDNGMRPGAYRFSTDCVAEDTSRHRQLRELLQG